VARGWESKSVEDQINEREAAGDDAQKNNPSPQDLERKSRRSGMLLARSRTQTSLDATRDGRYRALLERTLEHLDSELKKLA